MITPLLRPIHRPRFFIPPRIALVVLALGGSALLCNPAIVRAADDAAVSSETTTATTSESTSYRLFYDKLADEGDWLQTEQYGYVFQPRVAVEDKAWRPYTDGYWAQTDAGWTWVSNENFGWAAYHYGRWANLVDVGWVWVPGSEWSPAYVSWRVSKDHKHIGWAPLPPEARLTRGQGIEAWADTAYDIGPEAYVFIDSNHFGEKSYRTHVTPVEQNATIITQTENVTRTSYRTVEDREVIYDGGPDVAVIREVSGQPVRQMHLELRPEKAEFFQREDYRGISTVNGDRFVVATAAPDVITSTTIRTSQPVRVRQRLTEVRVDRGYRGIGDQQTIERYRTTLRSQSPQPPPTIEREVGALLRRTSAVPLPDINNRGGTMDRMDRRGEAAAGTMDRRGEAGAAAGAMDRRGEAGAAGAMDRRGEAGAAASGAMDRRGGSAASSPAASPADAAASPAVTNPRGQRARRNAADPSSTGENASPAASPASRSAASPSASPAAEASPASERRAARTRAEASPGAEPTASPAERTHTPAATTPRPHANAAGSEASPAAGGSGAERTRQPGAASREAQPSATPATERRGGAAAEREGSSAGAARRDAESASPAHSRSEATPAARSGAEEPAQRRERPAATGGGEEKKTQTPAAGEGASSSRRNAGASDAEARSSGGGGAQARERSAASSGAERSSGSSGAERSSGSSGAQGHQKESSGSPAGEKPGKSSSE